MSSQARVRTDSWHPTSKAPLPAVETYQLGARVDDGGTNELYEAIHPSFPGPVLVKLLHRAVEKGAASADACQLEAAQVARLGHPNIAAVVALGRRPDGLPFLVRESLRGETLDALLARRGRLSAGETAAIVSGMAAGLAAAHGAKVLHGELRPSKVFLAEAAGYAGGFVKLLDFGLWRLAAERHGPGARADVARFTAPELLDGAKVDARTDEFALAAIAYRMLAGKDAFPGDDVAAVLRAVSRGTLVPLRSVVRCNPAIDAVIRRGLARRPADRYGTVLAFARALESASIPRQETPENTQAVSTWQLISSQPAGAQPAVAQRSQPVEEPSEPVELSDVRDVEVTLDRIPRHRRLSNWGWIAATLVAAVAIAWWTDWRIPAELQATFSRLLGG
jgi:eukaryotic-like serine/threonine-protein kinase